MKIPFPEFDDEFCSIIQIYEDYNTYYFKVADGLVTHYERIFAIGIKEYETLILHPDSWQFAGFDYV